MNVIKVDFPSAQDCYYTSHYCEENIWKLCESVSQKNIDIDSCYCVFVSNNTKVTPLWYQKVGTGDDFCVFWDYHVFLVRKNTPVVSVYDFDTTLGFPVPFMEYIEKSIGLEITMAPEYRRYFRVIPANEYLKCFSSDRRHMKKPNGEWLEPPPPYEPIQSNESKYNLDEFISMKSNEGPGIVMNLADFVKYFKDT